MSSSPPRLIRSGSAIAFSACSVATDTPAWSTASAIRLSDSPDWMTCTQAGLATPAGIGNAGGGAGVGSGAGGAAAALRRRDAERAESQPPCRSAS